MREEKFDLENWIKEGQMYGKVMEEVIEENAAEMPKPEKIDGIKEWIKIYENKSEKIYEEILSLDKKIAEMRREADFYESNATELKRILAK